MTFSTTRDLTQGPITRTLLAFAMPILAGNVLQSLNGSVNAVWVGKYLGEAALTATANANILLFVLIALAFGVGLAASIMVGQSIGAKNMAQARMVIGSSATFFGILSILIAGAGYPLARPLLAWMGTPADALPLAESYLRVIFLAVPLLYLFALIAAILRGAGDARTPFLFLLLVVVLDVALNPLLIFGLGPVPAMGITGSALATLVAHAISLSAMLLWLYRRQHPLWLGRDELHWLVPQRHIIAALVLKGLPMGAQMVMIALVMLLVMTMVNEHGVVTTSAYSAALQLWTYVQMPAMAIGAACSSMAAQNVGAGCWHRVHGTARSGVLCNLLMTGTLTALIMLLEQPLLGLFLPEDSQALATAQHLNHIGIGAFLLLGVTFVLSGVVRATGAVMPPLVILAVALWGVRIPVAQLLQPWLGVDAIWWSFPLSALCAMLMSMAYYRFGHWRQAHMMEGVAPAMPGAVASLAVCSPQGRPAAPSSSHKT